MRILCRTIGPDDLEKLVRFHEKQVTSTGLSILLANGNQKIASRLWKSWKNNGIPEGGFSLLGRFGIQAALQRAWEAVDKGDWYLCTDAVIGLCGLDCSPIAAEVRKKLDSMEGKGLFLEALPALATKVHWLEGPNRLYRWGLDCSSDCLGGIILGLGLYQNEAATTHFREMLDLEHREFYDSGTGNASWSWPAARLLGKEIPWLVKLIRDNPTETRFRILLAWLKQRLAWTGDSLSQLKAPPPACDLFAEIFWWGEDGNQDGSLRKLCPQTLLSEFYELKHLYEKQMVEELLLEQTCRSGTGSS